MHSSKMMQNVPLFQNFPAGMADRCRGPELAMAAIQAWARHSSQVFKRQLKGIHEKDWEAWSAWRDTRCSDCSGLPVGEQTFETYWSPRWPQERLGLLLAALGDLATVALLRRALVYSNYHHMFVESMHDIHAFTHMYMCYIMLYIYISYIYIHMIIYRYMYIII